MRFSGFRKLQTGKFLTVLLLFLLFSADRSAGQIISNTGTDFWIVFPTHVPDFDPKTGTPALANLSIFITGKETSAGTIEIGLWRKNFSIEPNKVTEIAIPREQAYVDASQAQQVLSGKGIHLRVNNGSPPIVAYAHIFAGNRSAATLLLPKEALGKQYYSINYQQQGQQGQNYLAIVASDPNTLIRIRGKGKELINGGVMLTEPGDVFEYLSNDDLSGASVSVDETVSPCGHFALFSGSTGTAISSPSCTARSFDPLYQQCFPVGSWGKEYGFIPFSMISPDVSTPVRTAGQYVRVIAKDNQTQIYINGKAVAILNAGEYFTTPEPLRVPSRITGTKPICVAQYALTQNCSQLIPDLNDQFAKSLSDPDMVILNPIEFSIHDLTVYSSKREKITEQYLNILIPSTFSSSFLINDQSPAEPFKPVFNMPGFDYLQLNLNKEATSTFHLYAKGGFNAVAYGFGQLESYAYAAGTNMAGTAALAAFRPGNELPIDSACADDDYFFRLTLPFSSSKISWDTGDPNGPVVQTDPMFSEIDQNGTPAYQYILPKPAAYRIPGNRVLKVEADFPTTYAGCASASQKVTQEFHVLGPPKTRFSHEPADCQRSVLFHDQTIDRAHPIIKYSWDFGDIESGSLNFSVSSESFHHFSHDGNYPVRLITTNSAGCQSVFMDSIFIKTIVIPLFTIRNLDCNKRNVIFQDSSRKDDSFKTLTRKWYFGDGDSVLASPQDYIAHTYSSAGRFKVKMVLVSSTGCSSDTAFQTVSIETPIKAAFNKPVLCESDQIARFINTSQIPSDSLSIRYNWQFGDPFSKPGNANNSTDKNPSHVYTAAGNYKVSLTVMTAQGCAESFSTTIAVNGTRPKAAFDFLSSATLCNGQPLLVKNRSAMIDFGNITRLEWYYDAVGFPALKTVINSPLPGAVYTYVYPRNRVNENPETISVKLLAFSGTVCADSVIQVFTLLPSPQLIKNSNSTVCENAPPYQLPGVTQEGNLVGNGYYAGKGVSISGMFNPSVAGAGQHSVKYLFTSTGGCKDSVLLPITVYPAPAINWPTVVTVYPGEKVLLRPTMPIAGLSYQWKPSEGLSRTDIPDPQASPDKTTTYTVSVSNGQCDLERTMTVRVLNRPVIPSAFTPNGDGYNDLLNIAGVDDYPDIKVDIYNRYGSPVFQSTGYAKAWDGKYNGQDMPAGVYYYIIRLPKQMDVYSGYVTLIR